MSADFLNRSLDEFIAMRKNTNRGAGASRGRARGGGRNVTGFNGSNRGRRIPTVNSTTQRTSNFGGRSVRSRRSNFNDEKLCTVRISNLGPGVTTRDLQELFAEYPCVDVAVHLDKFGNSRGTAVVLFEDFGEAMRLKTEFTGAKLDGRVMELFAVSNKVFPSGRPQTRGGGVQRGRIGKFTGNRQSNGYSYRRQSNNNNAGGPRPGRPGKSRGTSKPQMSVEELDRELESYMRSSKHAKIVAP